VVVVVAVVVVVLWWCCGAGDGVVVLVLVIMLALAAAMEVVVELVSLRVVVGKSCQTAPNASGGQASLPKYFRHGSRGYVRVLVLGFKVRSTDVEQPFNNRCQNAPNNVASTSVWFSPLEPRWRTSGSPINSSTMPTQIAAADLPEPA
jgi:hypothetical protein